MKLYNEVSPTLSELRSRKMEFSLGPKQISNTQINQLIEAEVEKRIRERATTEEPGQSLKKRLLPEYDDQDEEKKLKTIYQERLEKMIQGDEQMKKIKEEKDEKLRRRIEAQIEQ